MFLHLTQFGWKDNSSNSNRETGQKYFPCHRFIDNSDLYYCFLSIWTKMGESATTNMI